MPSTSFLNTIHRWRSRVGFFGLVLVLILSRPSLISFLLGLGICLLGLLIRTWASGHLIKEKKLIVSGPYQYTRNPLYFANLIIGISVVVATLSWFVLTIFVVYFLLFYPPAVKREKRKMKNLFPKDYKEYEQKVPLFFPSLKPHRSAVKRKFDWGLYKRNKEYRALLGGLLFWVLLAGRLILF